MTQAVTSAFTQYYNYNDGENSLSFCFRWQRRVDTISNNYVTVSAAGCCHISADATSEQLCQAEEDDKR